MTSANVMLYDLKFGVIVYANWISLMFHHNDQVWNGKVRAN